MEFTTTARRRRRRRGWLLDFAERQSGRLFVCLVVVIGDAAVHPHFRGRTWASWAVSLAGARNGGEPLVLGEITRKLGLCLPAPNLIPPLCPSLRGRGTRHMEQNK